MTNEDRIQVIRDCLNIAIEEQKERLDCDYNAQERAENLVYGGIEDAIGKIGVKYFKELMEGVI